MRADAAGELRAYARGYNKCVMCSRFNKLALAAKLGAFV